MKSSPSHLPSLFSSLLFVLGAVTFSSVALLMIATALASLFTGEEVRANQTIVMAVSVFEALVLAAATFVSIQRFRQKPFAEKEASFTISLWQLLASLVVAGLAFFIGYRIGTQDSFNWLLLPFLTLPAVALPLFVLLSLGIRRIPLGTRWQSWNVFGLAMTLVPFILIILEVISFLVVLTLIIAVLMVQPHFSADIERLTQQLYALGPESEAARALLVPYLAKPGVLAAVLFYFSLVVPVLEEIFKPLGVWFFAKKLASPAQGFALGALSGSAYALIETLGVSAQTADWASLLLTRIGTGVLHITTSALMGAGIFYAVRERRYFRLLAIYILSIFLHGLWNALALLYSFSTLMQDADPQSWLTPLETPLMAGLIALAVILLSILLLTNRRMRVRFPRLEPSEPQL